MDMDMGFGTTIPAARYGQGIFTPRSWCYAVLVCLLFLVPAASANTSVFTDSRTCSNGLPTFCSTLSNFGLLTGTSSDLLTINGGWTFNGGIGVGNTAELSSSGTNTANGIVDFSNAVSSGTGNCGTVGSGTNFCTNGGTWSGTSPSQNASRVNTAGSDLDNIITQLLTYTTANGTQTSIASSGSTYDVTLGLGGGTMKIYRQGGFTSGGSFTFGCGGTTCSSDMLVLIAFTGTTTVNFKHDITLTDGLTADQVIFFVPTAGLTFGPTAAATTPEGTFIVGNGGTTNRTVTVGCTSGSCDPVNIYGRLYNDNGAITFNNKGGSMDDDGYIDGTPEPGTWILMGCGLAAVVFEARRRKRAADARG